MMLEHPSGCLTETFKAVVMGRSGRENNPGLLKQDHLSSSCREKVCTCSYGQWAAVLMDAREKFHP